MRILDEKLGVKNNIVGIKIDVRCDSLFLRSVPKQQPPYLPLIEVVDQQKFSYSNKSGIMVGFRFPDYLKGVNVPGYHFHFISDDYKKGGHILAMKGIEGTIYLDTESEFHLSIAQDKAFNAKDLSKDRQEALEKVESGK